MKLLFAALACLLLGGVSAQYAEPNTLYHANRATVAIGDSRGNCTGWVLNAEEKVIVTNAHCARNAVTAFYVTSYAGEKRMAELVGISKDIDVAVFRVRGDITLEQMRIGGEVAQLDEVYAIGHGAGFAWTVSKGVVQYVNRVLGTGFFSTGNFIQHQAPINKGNSGGPLLNSRWEIVGMNTLIFTDKDNVGWSGIGMAIPIRDILIEVQKIIGK